MSGLECRHPDIRKFDGVRCCLACGEAVFEPPVLTRSKKLPRDIYKYTNLNYKLGQEMRLLVVFPGEPTEALRCDIIHVNLDDNPDYEAVSYTWASDNGDASLSRTVECGDSTYVPITVNCDAALRQLRKRGLKRRLWIDAICINQRNPIERNHQVGLMDGIYSHARNVRICLQDHCPNPEFVKYGKLFRWLQHGPRPGATILDTQLYPTLNRLLAHRYFRRAWVLQEVALARVAYLSANENEVLLSQDVIDQVSHIAGHRLPGVLSLRQGSGSASLGNIVACLRAGMESECTDPRDRVFAVLSLMDPQFRSLIPIDYSLESESVYANALLAVIINHRNLDILSYMDYTGGVRYDKNSSQDPVLTIKHFRRFLIDKDSQYQADTGGSVNSTLYIPQKPRLVQLSGQTMGPWRAQIEAHIIDKSQPIPETTNRYAHIPTLFQRLPDNPTISILPRFQVRAHYIDTIRRIPAPASVHVTMDASDFGNKLWTAYHFGHDNYPFLDPSLRKRDPAENRALLKPLEDLLQSGIPDVRLADILNFIEMLKDHGRDQEILRTSNSLGFARWGFQPNDEIWALDGARVPFILHKTGYKTFRIVSDCYVWAALASWYWVSGSGAGSLHRRQLRAYEKDTHVIEIH